jgi:hypothetical protein
MKTVMQTPTGSRPAPAPAPAPGPAPAATPAPDVHPGGATAVWQGAIAARRELNNQRVSLQDLRRGVAEQLRNPMVEGADRQGLEQQIVSIDANIGALDKEIAAANSRVASTTLVPGAVVEQPHERSGPYIEGSVLSALFIMFVLFPLSVSLGLRFLRRGAATVAALPREMMERFDRLDQAVDTMAIEVERIGESQRFVTRLMSERATPERVALERERSS